MNGTFTCSNIMKIQNSLCNSLKARLLLLCLYELELINTYHIVKINTLGNRKSSLAMISVKQRERGTPVLLLPLTDSDSGCTSMTIKNHLYLPFTRYLWLACDQFYLSQASQSVDLTSATRSLFLSRFSFTFFLMTIPFASIDIIPESDTIHLFNGENVIPSGAYTLRGFVQLKLMRPLKVRRISIRFKGIIRSILSNEAVKHAEPPTDIDSSDPSYWPASFFHPRSRDLSLADRMALRAAYIAMGYSNFRYTILSQSLHVLDPEKPVLIEEGTSRWPFELVIDNAYKLPPSILLPRHLIIYELSAQLQLASWGESIKLAYWNATVSFAHLSSPSFRHALVRRRSSTSSAEDVAFSTTMGTTTTENTSKLRPFCRVYKPIKVYSHDYASLQLLQHEPRIRYRGCRQHHMRYEVSVPSFVCLQQRKFELACKFERLRDEARIALIEIYLEQFEKYPQVFFRAMQSMSTIIQY